LKIDKREAIFRTSGGISFQNSAVEHLKDFLKNSMQQSIIWYSDIARDYLPKHKTVEQCKKFFSTIFKIENNRHKVISSGFLS